MTAAPPRVAPPPRPEAARPALHGELEAALAPDLQDEAGKWTVDYVRLRFVARKPEFVRLIADHIAGMSDSFALKEYERLYLPFADPEGR